MTTKAKFRGDTTAIEELPAPECDVRSPEDGAVGEPDRRAARSLPRGAGEFSSGRTDISERAEELLFLTKAANQ